MGFGGMRCLAAPISLLATAPILLLARAAAVEVAAAAGPAAAAACLQGDQLAHEGGDDYGALCGTSLLQTGLQVQGHTSLHQQAGGQSGLGAGKHVIIAVAVVAFVFIALFFMYYVALPAEGETAPAGGGLDKLAEAGALSKLGLAPQNIKEASPEAAPEVSPPPPRIGRMQTPAATGTGPPPICASLLLPHTEARFVIPRETLATFTRGNLDIMGTTGRKYLNASIEETPGGGRVLSLATAGFEADPCAVVSAPPPGPFKPAAQLRVYGRGGVEYGTLEVGGDGVAVLRRKGKPVMRLEPGAAADLALTACAADGRALAAAGCGLGPGSRRGEWRLHVRPGADAMLVAACALSALRLAPGVAK